jgi:rubrerythrin
MAMEVEQSGRRFYEQMAAACDDAGVAELCRDLAQEEAGHVSAFGNLRKQWVLPGRGRSLEKGERSIVRGVVDELVMPTPQECRRLAASGNAAEILGCAIRMERGAIGFFTRMAGGVDDKAALQRIIAEEQRHLEQLQAAQRRTR